MANTNGRDMWKEIETIGPPVTKAIIPEEVNIGDKTINDIKKVLDTLANNFTNLYKGIPDYDLDYDGIFLDNVHLELSSETPSVDLETNDN